jgi:hypothetical protein
VAAGRVRVTLCVFAPIFPAVNGFYWVNGFLFVRPTFLGNGSPDHRGRAAALLEKLSPRPNPSGRLVYISGLLLFVRQGIAFVLGGPVWCQFSPPVTLTGVTRTVRRPPGVRFLVSTPGELI